MKNFSKKSINKKSIRLSVMIMMLLTAGFVFSFYQAPEVTAAGSTKQKNSSVVSVKEAGRKIYKKYLEAMETRKRIKFSVKVACANSRKVTNIKNKVFTAAAKEEWGKYYDKESVSCVRMAARINTTTEQRDGYHYLSYKTKWKNGVLTLTFDMEGKVLNSYGWGEWNNNQYDIWNREVESRQISFEEAAENLVAAEKEAYETGKAVETTIVVKKKQDENDITGFKAISEVIKKLNHLGAEKDWGDFYSQKIYGFNTLRVGEIPPMSSLLSTGEENFESSISSVITELTKVVECVITFHGENENYKKLYDYGENFKKHADALKERTHGMSQKEKAWEIMESLLALRREEKERAKKLYEADKNIAPEELADPPFYDETTGIFRCYAQLAAILGFEKTGIFRMKDGTNDKSLKDCGAWVEIDGAIYAPGERDAFGSGETRVKWISTVSKSRKERIYQILKRDFDWEEFCIKNPENEISFSKWCEENNYYSSEVLDPWEEVNKYSLSQKYDYIRENYEEYQRIQAQDVQERLHISSKEQKVLWNIEHFTEEQPYYQGNAMEVDKVEYCLLTKDHWIELWSKREQEKMKMIDINTESMMQSLSEQYVIG